MGPPLLQASVIFALRISEANRQFDKTDSLLDKAISLALSRITSIDELLAYVIPRKQTGDRKLLPKGVPLSYRIISSGKLGNSSLARQFVAKYFPFISTFIHTA